MRLKRNQRPGRQSSWMLFCLMVLCMLALSGRAHGQGLGKIVGTVQDPSGATILNATVTVTEVGKGLSRTANTDASGFYVLNSLRPAQYDLSVEANGFRTFDQKAITLLADQTLTLNVNMQVGSVTESVAVVSQTDQVDTTTSTLKQVIEQQRITELPLNGRNAATLTLTVSGASVAPSGGADQGSTKTFPGAVTYSVNGARQGQISYQLDGGNNVDEYTNVNQPFPMPDALQEFSVQTSNYSAQYGQNAGAVVNVVTRSGTNQFHGNAFEFLRNKAFNARPWAGVVKDPLKRNQAGGTFGGPIKRDKTFFFGGYQRTWFRTQAADQSATVPTAAERATATDPAIINLLKGIPVGDSSQTAKFNGRLDIQDFQEVTARVDHSFSQTNQLTFRYFFDHFTRNAVFDPSNFLRYSDGSTIKSQNYLAHWTHVFKPTLINDFRFSYAPENATRGPAPNAIGLQDLGVKLPFGVKAIQAIRTDSGFSFGDNPQASFIRNNVTWSDDVSWVINNHDVHFGGAIERSQVDLDNQFFQPAEIQFRQFCPGDPTSGAGAPGKFTNFLAGKMCSTGNPAIRQGAGEIKNNRNKFIGIYIQDNYKLNRRLTLNLGLRWEPTLPWHELQGRVEQFSIANLIAGVHSTQFPGAPPGVLFPGDTGVPRDGIRANYSNFAPRVGFAYDVFGDSKTSIRGGFGIFYDSRIPGIVNNRFVDLYPFSPQFILSTATGAVKPGSFSDPLCSLAATQVALGCTNQTANYPFPFTYPPAKNISFGSNVFVDSWDPVNKYQTPTVYNWNLSVERQMPSNILVRAAYVGSHSSHLTETISLNQSPVGGGTPRLNALAGNPSLFSAVQQDLQDINANYNSLQLGVEKRVSHGLTVLVNYTYSRSTDDLPPGQGVEGFDQSVYSARPWDDPLRHQFDTGPSEFDHTHRFVGSYVWVMPSLKGRNALVRGFLGEWQFSGLVQAHSGRPITILSGVDRSGTAINQDRGVLIGNPYGAGACVGATKACKDWLNFAGFTQNAAGTFGTISKGSLRYPGLYLWDMGLSKTFSLTERFKLQLRGEFFNIFNHVNFDEAGATGNLAKLSAGGTKGNFGALTTALDPRIGQVALKVIF
jgi:Carboxypeptidase regulatory-like domain